MISSEASTSKLSIESVLCILVSALVIFFLGFLEQLLFLPKVFRRGYPSLVTGVFNYYITYLIFMKKKLTLFAAILTSVIALSQSTVTTPYALKGLELTYLTTNVSCVKLKVSGFDYYSASVQFYSNNKIQGYTGSTNSLFTDQEERATSVTNGNEIEYLCEIKKPSSGINDFTKIQEERFFFDGNTLLDTMVIIKKHDVSTGALNSTDTVKYLYNGTKLIRVVGKISYSEYTYNGALLDRITTYQNTGFSFSVVGYNQYNYNGSTLTSITKYEDQGSGLTNTDNVTVTQNASNFTTTFVQSNGTTYKFNEDAGCSPVNDEQVTSSKLKVYPNPAQNYIVLEGNTNSDYSIYGMDGKLVQQGTIFSGEISVSKLAVGTYFLRVNQFVLRFEKQ